MQQFQPAMQPMPMQQQQMVGVDVNGDGKADYMQPGLQPMGAYGQPMMMQQQQQQPQFQQMAYGQVPQATAVPVGPQPIMGTPAPAPGQQNHNVVVKPKGTAGRSGNASCMYCAGVVFFIVGLGMLLGGISVVAVAEEMNPDEDFEETICQISCIEHDSFERSHSVCRSRRSGCSGDDSQCCSNWDDVIECYDSYEIFISSSIDEAISPSNSDCTSSDIHELPHYEVSRGEVAASCSELGAEGQYGYGDPELGRDGDSPVVMEGDMVTCWVPQDDAELDDLEHYECPNSACYKVNDPAGDKAALEVLSAVLFGVCAFMFVLMIVVCCCGCAESRRLA